MEGEMKGEQNCIREGRSPSFATYDPAMAQWAGVNERSLSALYTSWTVRFNEQSCLAAPGPPHPPATPLDCRSSAWRAAHGGDFSNWPRVGRRGAWPVSVDGIPRPVSLAPNEDKPSWNRCALPTKAQWPVFHSASCSFTDRLWATCQTEQSSRMDGVLNLSRSHPEWTEVWRLPAFLI